MNATAASLRFASPLRSRGRVLLLPVVIASAMLLYSLQVDAASPPQSRAPPTPVRSASAPGDAIVVPLHVAGGRYVADLHVGATKLRAHVDTGGFGALGILPKALPRVRVNYTGTTSTRTDGAGQQWMGRAFVAPVVRLGGRKFADFPGYERTEAASGDFGGDAPFDAVLGRDFLERYTVVVDYPHRRLELHPPAAGERVCNGEPTTLFRLQRGFWASEVVTDHGSLILIWDTGAHAASFVKEKVARDLDLPSRQGAYRTTKFMVGERDLGPTELHALKIGGALDADGMIGSDVFAKHRVCFDLERGIVSTG